MIIAIIFIIFFALVGQPALAVECATGVQSTLEQNAQTCVNAELQDRRATNYCESITDSNNNNVCDLSADSSQCTTRTALIFDQCNTLHSSGQCTGDCPSQAIMNDFISQFTRSVGVSTEPVEAPLLPRLQIPVPGLTPFTAPFKATTETGETVIIVDFLARYIVAIYTYLVAIASILAGVMYVWAGLKWLTAAGNPERITDAKNKIAGASVGLVLVLGSYIILKIVNPQLVLLKPLQVEYIKRELLKVDEAQAEAGDIGQGTGNVPYFGQYESAWGQKKPGDPGWEFASPRSDCTTIQQRGCGTTSLAMVLNYYGENVTPLDTAAWGLGCSGAWQPTDTLPQLAQKWPGYQYEIIYRGKVNRIFEILRQGKPIIYNCAPCTGYKTDGTLQPRPYNGHFMVLTGIDAEGNITVNDPGRNATNRTAYFTEDQIRQEFKVGVYLYK